ncbi:MAG: YtfJ family protein [Archangium sp.]|nr:YtfJ family protein [Archangium sp.]MDP3153615.1 YtfJ family protein [Archangium sp.]MDP3569317.1 YtfJ family protein [Archangium sp.]
MRIVKAKWIGVAMTVSAAGAWGQPMDARISNTKGQSVWMTQLWGKPTVIFYEDKDATFQNQPLKDELFKKGKEKGLLDAVSVIAIANVRAFDWFPAKNFVVAAVKDAEKKSGVPVYVDWTGSLSSKPWNLSATGSNVLVIDATGEKVLFSKVGALTAAEIDQVFELLTSLVVR